MKNRYDFILIEPRYWAISHYNYDQKNLADILFQAGYKVAVINFVQKNDFHKNQKYDLINIFPYHKFPDRENANKENNLILRFVKRIVLDYRRYLFFKEILEELKSFSNNIYLGTQIECSFPLFLMNYRNKNTFYWGYRSFLITKPINSTKRNPYTALKFYYMSKKIKKNKNIKLFVSNHIIKNEYVNYGIEKERLIYRPERTINKLPKPEFEKLNKKFTLLNVGYLRKEKNLEFSVNCIKNKDIKLIIAGKSNNDYAFTFDKKIQNSKYDNIIRIKGFIPDDEYHDLFMQSHFLLLADKKQKSTVSNGTFLEALLKGRPVIVPDQKPYNYYVNKYQIGLLFENNNEISLLDTINKAKKMGCKYFENNLKKFQKEYLIDEVAKEVKEQLK